jgi:hypothetical protein
MGAGRFDGNRFVVSNVVAKTTFENDDRPIYFEVVGGELKSSHFEVKATSINDGRYYGYPTPVGDGTFNLTLFDFEFYLVKIKEDHNVLVETFTNGICEDFVLSLLFDLEADKETRFNTILGKNYGFELAIANGQSYCVCTPNNLKRLKDDLQTKN